MHSPLGSFENYISSLAELGVYASFQRHVNGWTCALGNDAGRQLMPLDADQACWGATIMESLTVAVEALNRRFGDPKELRRYIDAGTEQSHHFYIG